MRCSSSTLGSQEDPSSDHQTSDDWESYYLSIITLPRVQTLRKDINYFFGYDPVNGEYKVLCMTMPHNSTSSFLVSQEHQVFTLGARRKKWRKIECKHPHFAHPRTQWLCSNGVVYYIAWIGTVSSLMCYDVCSEKFSVIKLPSDGYVQYLSHYSEKIVATNLLDTGTLDLWVLEDARKSHWSQVSIVIPSWTDSYGHFDFFTLTGRLGTGELVFAPAFVTEPFYILCYDLKENKARKIQIEGIGTHLTQIHVYLDNIESSMFLEL